MAFLDFRALETSRIPRHPFYFASVKIGVVGYLVSISAAVVFRSSKNGRPISPAHFVSCVRVWDAMVEVAGSIPTGGIFSENV